MAGQSYATPTDDQKAWRDAAPASGQLPAHLVAFLQGGVAATLGARTAEARPIVGAGIACRVSSMSLVRVLVPRRPNAGLLEAIRGGSAIAATFSRARDHRSIQLKAAAAVIMDPLADDMCEAARQCAIFADELVELGYTRPQARAYVAYDPADLVSVEFRPDRIFTQTPGPGAGAELPR